MFHASGTLTNLRMNKIFIFALSMLLLSCNGKQDATTSEETVQSSETSNKWTVSEEEDSFGDKTGEKYISTYINAKSCGTELPDTIEISFHISKDGTVGAILLKDLPADIMHYYPTSLQIKTPDGKKTKFTAETDGASFYFINKKDNKTFLNLIKENKYMQMTFRDMDGTYRFTLYNDGLEQAIKEAGFII